ncbi:MAG: hypothetical protein KGD63_14685 [Candidatus Lokiarchaeota archaeon]|nr:hypothetical protein [Candidatus Lokiarchaeota archaeon]
MQKILEIKDIFGKVVNSDEFRDNFMKIYNQSDNNFSSKKKSWKEKVIYLDMIFRKLIDIN